MKKLDFIVILCVIILSFLILFSNNSFNEYDILIYVDGDLYEKISYNHLLNENIEINSEFGKNVIRIDKDGVCVLESSCKDKLDINAGYINKAGQSIICLPNRVVIKLEAKGEYDVVSY